LADDRATELLPSLTEVWFRAGALVYTLGHRDEAIGCFRRAAATGPKTSFGRLGAARALLTEDRDAEAERVLRRTLALDPTNAMAYDLLGNLLAEFGRFDEAHDCFARAIAIAPLMAGAYYDLVRCRPVTTADDGLLARMEAALATPGLEVGQRLRFTSRWARRRTTSATTPWRCSTSTWPTPCAGVRGHSARRHSTRRSTA
jgi:tetratricopeptide (TPR) repeat protein